MALADEIEAGFPPGTRLPADLRRLCDYSERAGDPATGSHDPQIGYRELRPAGDALRAFFRGDESAAGRFAAFGAGPPGSVLALWLHAGPDAAAAPVVHLGPHPLHHGMLAADARAFLRLLGVGYGDLTFDDLTIPAEEHWNAPLHPPERLRAWLSAEFGITPPTTGAELAREARARHPDLGAWVREWQRRAYPEPPAERYRRELRDVMVAAIQFNRIPKVPRPMQDPSLRRDLIRVAEFVSEEDLKVRIPAGGDAWAVAADIADDILGCVERGERDRLRPTMWGIRRRFAWWYELDWLGRAWYCVRNFGAPRRRTARPWSPADRPVRNS